MIEERKVTTTKATSITRRRERESLAKSKMKRGAFIFYLHYILLTSGLSGTSVLLGVFIKEYSDASSAEIGTFLMSIPLASIIIKPLFCSMADRYQKYQLSLILALLTLIIGYTPFIVIPFFPDFYLQHPRYSWLVLVLGAHIGFGGLGVAWSLGDALTMNISQKTGTPYGRIRLTGTISWGIYGWLVGQINENPYLPKMVAGFALLHVSLIVEILFLALWPKEDFEMCAQETNDIMGSEAADEKGQEKEVQLAGGNQSRTGSVSWRMTLRSLHNSDNTVPGSLCGTLRGGRRGTVTRFLNIGVLKDLWTQEEPSERLIIKRSQNVGQDSVDRKESFVPAIIGSNGKQVVDLEARNGDSNATPTGAQDEEIQRKKSESLQMVLLKMILREDKRLIKYLVFYSLFGFFMSPMNFVFLSLPDLCKERQCNFSQIAGALLIAQGATETLAFLIVPMFMAFISHSKLISIGFFILVLRFTFFLCFYEISAIPPYCAVIGDFFHGVSYGIFMTLMASIALKFANESRHFIPELRRLGLISERQPGNEEQVKKEEQMIKTSLRATMQSLFSGITDGLGNGTGCLACGLIVEGHSYARLWIVFTVLVVGTLISQVVLELIKCRYSDNFHAKPGTKAYEIMESELQEKQIKK